MRSVILRLVSALAVTVLCVSMCACGSEPASNETTTTEQNVTTTVADDITTTVVDDETTTLADGETTNPGNEAPTTVGGQQNVTTVKPNATTAKPSTNDPWIDSTTTKKDETTVNITLKPTDKPTSAVKKTTTTTKKVTTTTAAVDDSTTVKDRTYNLTAVKNKLNIYGRTGVAKSGLFFDHGASGIEFTAYMEGEVKLSISQTGTTYFTVWIDGVRQEERLCATKKSFAYYTLANFEEGGVHTIRVLKQTELQLSQSIFKVLSFKGYLMDVKEERELFIEFLGDSITSGYGNLMFVPGVGDPNDGYAGSAINSDTTQAYAFLTAEKLNARCNVISDSGIGLRNGYVSRIMSQFWDYTSFARQDLGKYAPTDVPDVVVINLGTNDEGRTSDAEMVTAVKELIEQIRATYRTDVPIVWASGMMNGAKSTAVKKALGELGGEGAGLYFKSLSHDSAGGGGHPGLNGHKNNADILADYLKSKNLV